MYPEELLIVVVIGAKRKKNGKALKECNCKKCNKYRIIKTNVFKSYNLKCVCIILTKSNWYFRKTFKIKDIVIFIENSSLYIFILATTMKNVTLLWLITLVSLLGQKLC